MTDSNREKLTETFLAFLEYCCNSAEVEYVQPGFAFYPIGLTDEQADNARNLGSEIIRKMSDPMIDKIITRNGATGHLMKVFPTSGSEYTQYNDRNAGYIIYNLIFAAMGYANGGDFNKQTTFGEFSAAIQQALAMEFPGYELVSNQGEQGNAQKTDALLPVLTEIRPKNAIIAHTNVANSLTLPEPWGGEWKQMSLPGFPVSDWATKTYFSLEWDAEGSGITPSRKISLYDKSVQNAAITLYSAGNDIITDRQICAAMKGAKTDNSGIDAAALAKVKRSIEKQRRTMIKIDATSSFAQRNIVDVEAEIETYLLPLDKITVQAKGKKAGGRMTAYRFMQEPPILTHARALKQIYSIPIQYLQTGKISATDSVVILRDYLINRIEAARDGKLNKKILYSTIYDQMELKEPSIYDYSGPITRERKKGKTVATVTLSEREAYKEDLDRYRHDTKRVRDQVKGLLENWKTLGYIKGYTESKKSKTIEAVTVKF